MDNKKHEFIAKIDLVCGMGGGVNGLIGLKPSLRGCYFSSLRSCHLYKGKIIDKTFTNANRLIQHGLMSL